MFSSTVASDTDPRDRPRSNVYLSAMLRTPSDRIPVRIWNISEHGALVQCEYPLQEGIVVHLERGCLETIGEIAWCGEPNYCGIRFDEEVHVAQWVRLASSGLGHSESL